MNQDTILRSNLLDIIFENRNKDYGAYILRKTYNSRLRLALFSMIGICGLLSFFILNKNSNKIFVQPAPSIFIPDITVSEFHTLSNLKNKSVAKVTHKIKTPDIEKPPKIVSTIDINKIPATPPENLPSFTGTSVAEINFPSIAGGNGNNKENGNGEAIVPVIVKPKKSGPLNEAEIMPQYPGGIKALLAFLGKNIHSPEDVEAGEEVSVKIKFVVNYNGKLESFSVIKSGGDIFDNEVLRVLKKMPLWIPGKSNGENVSVYYVVPVKFTTEY